MNRFGFLKYFLCLTLSFLIFTSPVFAGANVASKGEGDEVPSYVRSNITGFDTIANNLVFVWLYIQYTSPPPLLPKCHHVAPPRP